MKDLQPMWCKWTRNYTSTQKVMIYHGQWWGVHAPYYNILAMWQISGKLS